MRYEYVRQQMSDFIHQLNKKVYKRAYKRYKKRLLKEFTVDLVQPFPKDKDIFWKKKNLEDGNWHESDEIDYK